MKLSVFLLASIIFIAGCVGATQQGSQGAPSGGALDYRDVELRDVNSGAAFKLSDFKGKVVVLEAMAVWCPLCTQQQREIRDAERSLGSADVVSVSIDVDPNEDETKLKRHAEGNGFEWRFAVAPRPFAQQLGDRFGFNVLNPPSTPVIIFDKNNEPHMLRFGIKGADELKSEIQKYL